MRNKILFGLCLMLAVSTASAGEIISIKRLSMELARDIADSAIVACRDQGYQVAAVVVDRDGIPQAVLRDVLASRFTLQIAEDKANAVVLSGVRSAEFRKNRSDIRMEMNHVDGILVLEGGVPIRAGGALVGALGVSGAPGGDKDEACALRALEKLQERLEFAD